NDVTIGGESAGSFNTFALLLSPQAEGLFQKAALESGALTYVNANQMRLDKAIEIGKQVAAQFGADDSKEGLEILRKADPMDLWNVTALNILNIMGGGQYTCYPVYDGAVLPLDSPLKAIEEGKFNKNVTILMGNNRYEGLLFVHDGIAAEEDFNTFIKNAFREDSYQEVIDYYAAQTDRSFIDKANELNGMTIITLGVIAGEDAYEDAGAKLYVYEFNYTDSEGGMQTHAVEMPFVFGQDTLLSGDPMEGDDLLIRDATHAYWVNFIKTGNPNGGALMEWPEYVKDSQTILEIDATPAQINRSKQDVVDFLLPRYIR
ncbi:MAG TPA: carboxylesterase family protein, partial [Methanocorpusculum sp.]|nr:carboxylesterase family protein [Methanocorpusculum sp.]